jgi:phosphate-selective porin OprO/OprP
MERALTSALTPDRDVGLMVWGDVAGGILNYSVGVFDGAVDSSNFDTDNGVHKDVAGRLFVQPFKSKSLESLGQLGIGIAGTWGKRDGRPAATNLSAYRDVGRLEFFRYLAPTANAMTPDVSATTVYATGEQTRINPELFYYNGGLGLLGELVISNHEVRVGTETEKLSHKAWHATLSYVLWGKNGLDGATPSEAWNPAAGNYGAVEIAARYHWLELDEDTFPTFANPAASASRAQGFGFGVNWAWSRMFRLALNFENTKFKGGAAAGADRKTESVLLGRVQVVL